jgi:CDP-diacylglycerol--serine O-phosphatidyltransferase
MRDHLSFLFKPRWAEDLDRRIAALPLPVAAVPLAKLIIITPLLVLGMYHPVPLISSRPWLLALLFLLYLSADHLDEIMIAARGREKSFHRTLSRLSDYPLLLALAFFAFDVLAPSLIIMKVMIDLILLALYLLRRGPEKNRLRSGVNYATLIAMLFASQGLGPRFITPELVNRVLVAAILYHSIIALYYLKVLQKRFIADVLSGVNLLCGIFSMIFAWQGRLEYSLVFLMLGAAFDGFDGAAARKFGGTSWGVYSDDVADAVNYGIAPGVAIYFTLPGLQGIVLGPFYIVFTLSRLFFFTLNKAEADPNYFSGVPSTIGGIISLCGLILFQSYPAIVGLLVGVACILMVSFDTSYRHLGRALSQHRRAFFGMPLLLIILIAGHRIIGPRAPVALILASSLIYGLNPSFSALLKLIRANKDSPGQ